MGKPLAAPPPLAPEVEDLLRNMCGFLHFAPDTPGRRTLLRQAAKLLGDPTGDSIPPETMARRGLARTELGVPLVEVVIETDSGLAVLAAKPSILSSEVFEPLVIQELRRGVRFALTASH